MKTNINQIVTLLIVVIILTFTFCSCDNLPAGTAIHLNKDKNDSIQVFRYYYEDGNWVYVARFKEQRTTLTTTYDEQQGKNTIRKYSISRMEFIVDSIYNSKH